MVLETIRGAPQNNFETLQTHGNVHYDLSIWLRHSRYSDHHCGYDFRPLNTVADRMPNPQTTDPSR